MFGKQIIPSKINIIVHAAFLARQALFAPAAGKPKCKPAYAAQKSRNLALSCMMNTCLMQEQSFLRSTVLQSALQQSAISL